MVIDGDAKLRLSSRSKPLEIGLYLAAKNSFVIEVEICDEANSAELIKNQDTITDVFEIWHEICTKEARDLQVWLLLAYKDLTTTDFKELQPTLEKLQDHLQSRTFINGPQISNLDYLVFGALYTNPLAPRAVKNSSIFESMSRWYLYLESTTCEQIKEFQKSKKHKDPTTKMKTSKANYDIGLKNAVQGQVVLRFPPEPSGYLHIGHAKAAMLNQYFARNYNGKLIVRFDDTNPAKEKVEFEESIKEDLALIGINADIYSHSSDYFAEMFAYAKQLVEMDKAYADDTVQIKMREERMNGIASGRRDTSIEENLRIFLLEMARGTEEGLRWCLRAKISVDSPNKALRDPVIYRCCTIPHHRTGTQWKVYPTYDFCCPVVDSIEGVTHALRTIEYRDREAQYAWILKALNLPKINVWEFSRMNFVRTVLSKRKLQLLVNRGVVSGWDDPRMPTIRGIRRRGMTIEGLYQYMLSQGPSKNSINLEWTSLWAVNKKYIDPIAPRHVAIDKENIIKGIDSIKHKKKARHKKNSELGEVTQILSPNILIEQQDAQILRKSEEITLMDWGNAFVDEIIYKGDIVSSIEMSLHLQGDFKKTEKKLTWLADTDDKVSLKIHVFDYLLTKDKLEPEENFEDYLELNSEKFFEAYGDCNVREITQGTAIQFERKGYFICDKKFNGSSVEFFDVPDGKVVNKYGAKPTQSLIWQKNSTIIDLVWQDLITNHNWTSLETIYTELGVFFRGKNPFNKMFEVIYPINMSHSLFVKDFEAIFQCKSIGSINSLLLGIVDIDSTIVYYRVHDGLVKPIQYFER